MLSTTPTNMRLRKADGELVPAYGACVVVCQSRGVACAVLVARDEALAADRIATGAERLPSGYLSFLDVLNPGKALGLIADSFIANGLAPDKDGLISHRADSGVLAALAVRMGGPAFFIMAIEPGVASVGIHPIAMPESSADVVASVRAAVESYMQVNLGNLSDDMARDRVLN